MNFYKAKVFVLFAILMTLSIIVKAQSFNVPVEKSTFYSDNIINTSRLKAYSQTSASNTTWETVSVVENCFDQNNIGQSAWLMTSDGETQLSVTLKYNGDDSRYRISSQDRKSVV